MTPYPRALKTYILDDADKAIPEPDLMKWSLWMGSHDRHVADDTIGGYRVSTIFAGVDPSFGPRAPALWETLIFGSGVLDLHGRRCAGSREQALAMHAELLEHVRIVTSAIP